jgi:hypothetical protein
MIYKKIIFNKKIIKIIIVFFNKYKMIHLKNKKIQFLNMRVKRHLINKINNLHSF